MTHVTDIFVVIRSGWNQDDLDMTYEWLRDNYPNHDFQSDYGWSDTFRSKYAMESTDAIYFFENPREAVAFKLRFG